MQVVRGTMLHISSRFRSDADTQPTSVRCVICYRDVNDHRQTATIALTAAIDTWTDDDGNVHTVDVWSGSWDTSVAGPGRVGWVVQSVGPCQVAEEGHFTIVANEANGGESDEWRHDRDEFWG